MLGNCRAYLWLLQRLRSSSFGIRAATIPACPGQTVCTASMTCMSHSADQWWVGSARGRIAPWLSIDSSDGMAAGTAVLAAASFSSHCTCLQRAQCGLKIQKGTWGLRRLTAGWWH